MVKPIEIKIRTLTPLWTGDIDRKCTKLKETGIIGSLRWWYEALVRGLGGYACDPTSEGRCPDKNGKICDACKLFGCTGIKRSFNLRIKNNVERKELIFLSRIEHPVFYFRGNKRSLDFWFKELYKPPIAFYGNISLEIISNNILYSSVEIAHIVKFLLKLISIGGGLAAKTQSGFGIIKLLDTNIEEIREGYQLIQQIIKNERKGELCANFPSISNYLSFEITFNDIDFLDTKKFKWWPKLLNKNAEYYQIGFCIKFLLRNLIKNDKSLAESICKNYIEIEKKCEEIKKEKPNIAKKYIPSKVVARSIFGSDVSKKWASLVFVSDVWKENGKYKMRIWSFIPEVIIYDKVKINNSKIIELNCIIDKDKLMEFIRNSISNVFENTKSSEIIDKKGLIKKVLEYV